MTEKSAETENKIPQEALLLANFIRRACAERQDFLVCQEAWRVLESLIGTPLQVVIKPEQRQ